MTPDAREEISMDNNARIRDLEAQMREVTATLARLNTTCEGTQKQTADMHRRLLENSPAGEPPLIDRINKAVNLYERASWVGKTGLWGLMTLAAMATAITQITNYLRSIGKG